MRFTKIFSKKLAVISGISIVLYCLIGFLLLPVIGKNVLQEKLSHQLNREVSVEKIVFNPLTLTAKLNNFVVKDHLKAPVLSAQKILVNISLSSIFHFAVVVSEISLENPYIKVIRHKDKSYNFSDMIKTIKNSPPSPDNKTVSDKKIFRMILRNVHISGGKLQFKDQFNNVSHALNDLSISLPLLSTKKKDWHKPSHVHLSFDLNGAVFDIQADSKPFSEDLSTQLNVAAEGIDVVHYLPYATLPETVQLIKSDLNINLKAHYQKEGQKGSILFQGNLKALNTDLKSDQKEDIVQIPAMVMDISPSSILENELNISKIVVSEPVLNIHRNKKGRLNVLEIAPQRDEPYQEKVETAEKTNGNGHTGKKPFLVTLKDFEINRAKVFLSDDSNPEQFKSVLFPLTAAIRNFKLENAVSGEYDIYMATETKETIESKGTFQTHPVKADGHIKISSLLFNKYAPYYESVIHADIDEGMASLSADFQLSEINSQFNSKVSINDFLIEALTISSRQTKEKMINIPEFQVKGATFDTENKKIDTGRILTKNGRFFIKRNKNNEINLIQSIAALNKNETATKKSNRSVNMSSPWQINMTAIDLNGFDIIFNDLIKKDPITLKVSDVSVKAENLKNYNKEKGFIQAQMKLNKQGRIEIKGNIIPSESTSDLDIQLKNLGIKSFQPYFTDAVKIVVTDGKINTAGKLKLNLKESSGGQLQFAGESSITNFVSLDKKTAKDFFKCNSLYFYEVETSLFPVKFKAKDISLTDFYSRITVNDTGETNLKTVFEKDAQKKKKDLPEKKDKNIISERPQVHIDRITLQGGNIHFSDYLTQPQFNASMKQIAGSVTDLSSENKSKAKLHLQGVHGEASPLVIVGRINPLSQEKFADIDITFKDIELSKFTPYSSKYLGYKIEKGKLILDLDYLIVGNTLKSENRVRFNNFTLGERVESEKATSLPIGLAISLLENSDGQINLDLPVTGELDDPEFKIGAIIFKMVGNLILKVVTSPFSIIGSMFGGGEELGFIDFQYGETTIAPSSFEKLDTLAQILEEKAKVNLEIKGLYDVIRDAEGLRMKQFEDLLKAKKINDLVASGSPATDLKQVLIGTEDEEQYTHQVYAESAFPKPKDEKGLEKKLTVAEKRKLIITNIRIGKDDLRLLAMNRSEKIKAYLLSTGKVEKERIFLVEPGENSDSKTDTTSKVKFSFK